MSRNNQSWAEMDESDSIEEIDPNQQEKLLRARAIRSMEVNRQYQPQENENVSNIKMGIEKSYVQKFSRTKRAETDINATAEVQPARQAAPQPSSQSVDVGTSRFRKENFHMKNRSQTTRKCLEVAGSKSKVKSTSIGKSKDVNKRNISKSNKLPIRRVESNGNPHQFQGDVTVHNVGDKNSDVLDEFDRKTMELSKGIVDIEKINVRPSNENTILAQTFSQTPVVDVNRIEVDTSCNEIRSDQLPKSTVNEPIDLVKDRDVLLEQINNEVRLLLDQAEWLKGLDPNSSVTSTQPPGNHDQVNRGIILHKSSDSRNKSIGTRRRIISRLSSSPSQSERSRSSTSPNPMSKRRKEAARKRVRTQDRLRVSSNSRSPSPKRKSNTKHRRLGKDKHNVEKSSNNTANVDDNRCNTSVIAHVIHNDTVDNREKLNPESNYFSWRRLLEMDLESQGYSIERNENRTLNENRGMKRLLIRRVGDAYLDRLVQLPTFDAMLEHLELIRQGENNMSLPALQKRLSKLALFRGEKVATFFSRVEQIEREYSNAKHTLTEKEIVAKIFSAAVSVYPGIRFFIKMAGGLETISKDNLRSILLEEEQNRNNLIEPAQVNFSRNRMDANRPGGANRSDSRRRRDGVLVPNVNTCYKCGSSGHKQKECPNRGPTCFNCQLVGHKRKDCRFPDNGKGKSMSKYHNYNNNRPVYEPKGKFNRYNNRKPFHWTNNNNYNYNQSRNQNRNYNNQKNNNRKYNNNQKNNNYNNKGQNLHKQSQPAKQQQKSQQQQKSKEN